MTYAELKEKHGERALVSAATEIVIQGLRAVGYGEDLSPRTPYGLQIAAIAQELSEADWNDVRATIKRSL